ncbi:hypothetical protein QUB67_31885 [Microcoleus sp. ARI1-A1]|uniref:hypothetical protein n=1 Tax=unclassified Microcoleus TaxID=2642155 RepID=UPI002FD0823B
MSRQWAQKKSGSNSSMSVQKSSSSQRPFTAPVYDAPAPKQTPSVQAKRRNVDWSRVTVEAQSPAGVQAKLSVGAPGDKYEQEADAMANKVMTMPAPETEEPIGGEEEEVQTKALGNSTLQRETMPEEEAPFQTKQTSNPEPQTPNPSLENQLNSSQPVAAGLMLPRVTGTPTAPPFPYEGPVEFPRIPGETPFNPSMGQGAVAEGATATEGTGVVAAEGTGVVAAEGTGVVAAEGAGVVAAEGAGVVAAEGAGVVAAEGAAATAGGLGAGAILPVALAGAAGIAAGIGLDKGVNYLGQKITGDDKGDYSISNGIAKKLTSTDQALTSLWADPSKPEYTQTIGRQLANWLTPTMNEQPTNQNPSPAQLPEQEGQNPAPAIDPTTGEPVQAPANQPDTPAIDRVTGEPLQAPSNQDDNQEDLDTMSKTGRKKSKDVIENQKTRVEEIRRQRDALRSKPNKTPEDKEQIDKIDKALKKAENDLRASENHAQKSQKPATRN